MSRIWVTSDQHFGHDRIMQHCRRPFANARHMERELVLRHNDRVAEEDTVFFLGDFFMGGRERIDELRRVVAQLNGVKHLILGNHDIMRAFDYVECGFDTVHTALEYEGLVFVHDPAVAVACAGRRVVCGHVHNLWKVHGMIVNVSVDLWDYAPAKLEDVLPLFPPPEVPKVAGSQAPKKGGRRRPRRSGSSPKPAGGAG